MSIIPKYSVNSILYSLSVAAEFKKTDAVRAFKYLNITKLDGKRVDRIKLKDLQGIITEALTKLLGSDDFLYTIIPLTLLNDGIPLSLTKNEAKELKNKYPLSADLIMQVTNLPFDKLQQLTDITAGGPRGTRAIWYRL
jgi:hypothetical protein